MSPRSELRTIGRYFTSDGRGRVLFFIASGWFLSIGVRMVYPALLPHLRTAYGLDLTMAGLLLSVLWFAYAVGQLPGGLLADRVGEGVIMVVSTLVAAGTVLLVVTARSVPVLFLSTALLGLGTALYGVARFTALSDIYPERVGTAVGITMAAGDAGNAVLPVAAGVVAAAFAWQLGFGGLLPLFGLVAIGLWFVVPHRTATQSGPAGAVSRVATLDVLRRLRTPAVGYGTAALVVNEYIWQAFTAFYPTYLIEVKGLSSTLAVSLFGLFFALGGGMKIVAGTAYDRFGVRRTLLVILATSGAAFLLLPTTDRVWPLVALTVGASTFLGFSTIGLSYLTEALPRDIKGTGLGVLRTAYLLIGATSPFVFGAIANQGFFEEVFVLLAALAVAAGLVVVRLPGV